MNHLIGRRGFLKLIGTAAALRQAHAAATGRPVEPADMPAWQQQADVKQLPGVGPTDMTPWVHALAGVRYRGYVNPFMHGHPGTEVMAANLATA